MEIPSFLESQLINGSLILFLGSGASREATDKNGNKPPLGYELGIQISEKFLGGKFRDRVLTQIAEYAINESNLVQVQSFIKDIFEQFSPSKAHKGLTELKWKGIVTTNYDRLIEIAYEENQNAFQKPVPFIDIYDKIEDKIKSEQDIKLLKLHGCISRISNPQCPLILTTDQYIDYMKERRNLFLQLESWAMEGSILFIGYSLADQNFRVLLKQLDENLEKDSRPRYFAIMPNFEEEESRFWESKKITLIKGTLDEFIQKSYVIIPSNLRKLLTINTELKLHPIYEKFVRTDVALSKNATEFVENDIEYVNQIKSTKYLKPRDFYKGYNEGWAAIEQNLDVKRHIIDDILMRRFLIEDSQHEPKPEFILILGHAGSGKSVVHRRIAWDAAKELGYICLYLSESGGININAIQELINLTNERIFLFVDNVSERIKEIKNLLKYIGVEGNKLTIVACERINEWNMDCEDLYEFVTAKYEITYLSSNEIENLIKLLEVNNSLGTLTDKNPIERIAAFSERAGRQLLVALHEATLGKKFEEIIEDEYNNIAPRQAQLIYLSICVLNRLDVPVRAGIISRLHNVLFEEFEKKFFKPLEEVVFVNYNKYILDYEYKARHQHIAEIVFENILRDKDDKFNEYIQCLNELNISYSSDEKAFKQMIKASELLKMFSNPEQIYAIYKDAELICGEEAYLYHQKAIFEMKRKDGNMKQCHEYLLKALDLSKENETIKHSLAEYNLIMVEKVSTEIEREKLRNETYNIAYNLTKSPNKTNYAYHTLVKVGLSKIQELKDKGFEVSAKEIEDVLKEIQKNLAEGLQRYPGNSYLLSAEAELAMQISDNHRVITSLAKAFDANPRNTYIAVRLSKIFQQNGQFGDAKQTYEKALNASKNDPKLHYFYAKLLIEIDNNNGDEIIYHLKRSFSKGDKNYDAQILFGRQLFISNNEDYKESFRELSNAKISYEDKNRILYPLNNKFTGLIYKLFPNFFWILRDGIGDMIYYKKDQKNTINFQELMSNDNVKFSIGFNFKGPVAFDLEIPKKLF